MRLGYIRKNLTIILTHPGAVGDDLKNPGGVHGELGWGGSPVC